MTNLKDLRRKIRLLEKATEKPYEYNPERFWESESIQWSNYQDDVEKLHEAKNLLFETLQNKKTTKLLTN